jgi:hypothetical protein
MNVFSVFVLSNFKMSSIPAVGQVGFFFDNLRTRVDQRGCESGKGGNSRDSRPAEAGTGSRHPRRFFELFGAFICRPCIVI